MHRARGVSRSSNLFSREFLRRCVLVYDAGLSLFPTVIFMATLTSTRISLGIDLGTTDLKAALLGKDGSVHGTASSPVKSYYPKAGWSEQNPEEWWSACLAALGDLRGRFPDAWSQVDCIGLSGQMHGVVALDVNDEPVRPAIIWNDSRATVQAAELAERFASAVDLLGSVPMAGFTAPKVLWLKENEPGTFARIDCVMSPKDFLRLRLTGLRVTDTSDAAGTLWLDVPRRAWYEPIVNATGLTLRQLPEIVDGTSPSGYVTKQTAEQFGLRTSVVVAGGAGDNPASAVGIGACSAGDAFVTLGTSAAIVALTDDPTAKISGGIHRFAHTLRNEWYAMGAILSGASCLRWATRILSIPSEQSLLDLISGAIPANEIPPPDAPLFLPYLAGERTPHNDPLVRGGFMNLGVDTSPALLGYAVLEGVAFALRDAAAAVESSGVAVGSCALVGGGARSDYWAQLLSDVLGRELHTLVGSELGACIGAAKLGFAACGWDPARLKTTLPVKRKFIPQPARTEALQQRYRKFRSLFPAAQSLTS
ncbi:xylulokinase [Paraburkholderia ultramafica]|uniref:xylulokinase n=1 Tax=Paraburkholderia ultramafica TaxID=1544867 RepID=UPI001FE85CB0|nr:xylulokinase [Paraburkholderia ultramafica]